MLSLEKAYEMAEVERFWKRLAGKQDSLVSCVAMPKLDGLALALHYQQGKLVIGATRGDGHTGEDITANLSLLRGIPHQLPSDAPNLLELRGEVFMSRAAFIDLNVKRRDRQQKEYSNPRNAAAGTIRIRKLNPSLVRPRQLEFMAYWAQCGSDSLQPTTAGTFRQLAKLGFAVVSPWEQVASIEQFASYVAKLIAKRNDLISEVDGVVLRVDDNARAAQLGANAKSPRWAIAFKFKGLHGRTVLKDVVFQVGRSGVVTPVAKLEPVQVSGVTISSATLHNCEMLEQFDLKVGDTLELERAGDVIPKILGVVTRTNDPQARHITLPEYCPRCEAKLQKQSVNLQCDNPACQGVLLQRLEHFVSRNAMDIEGFGGKRLEQMVAAELVSRPAHLFALDHEQLGFLGSDAKKLTDNLISAIHKARRTTLDRVLFALSIPRLGFTGAKALAAAFGSLENLARAGPATLSFFKPVQFVVAQQVHLSLQTSGGSELQRLRDNGVEWPQEATAVKMLPVLNLLEHVAYLSGMDVQQLQHETPWPQLPPVLTKRLIKANSMPQNLSGLQAITLGDLEQTGMSSTHAQLCYSRLEQLLSFEPFQRLHLELETLAGVSWGQAATSAAGALSGLSVLVTGTLQGYDRKQAWDLVESHGGKIAQNVTAKTELVVAGNKPGAKKIAQATELKIKVISQDELFALLGSTAT